MQMTRFLIGLRSSGHSDWNKDVASTFLRCELVACAITAEQQVQMEEAATALRVESHERKDDSAEIARLKARVGGLEAEAKQRHVMFDEMVRLVNSTKECRSKKCDLDY